MRSVLVKQISILFLIAGLSYSVVVSSMQANSVRTQVPALMWVCPRKPLACFGLSMHRSFSGFSVPHGASFVDSIRKRKEKEVPLKHFRAPHARSLLKIVKAKLYETGDWPHVDPTPGKVGYCQLIASFLATKISRLNALNLDDCDDKEASDLLPLVKAYILQERHKPKEYQPLHHKLVKHKLESELGLVNESLPLSGVQSNLILKRTQESFLEDVLAFAGIHEETSIEESMAIAIDRIHASDCYIYSRYYHGTPDRADIFSVVETRILGNLYRRKSSSHDQWERLSTAEMARLLKADDKTPIIQIHFECQQEISDAGHTWGIEKKENVKKALRQNSQKGHCNSFKDYFGFSDSILNVRDFVMGGVRAINNLNLELQDADHPITVPCHFSVAAGMENLAKLLCVHLSHPHYEIEPSLCRDVVSRTDFANAALLITRYVSDWKNPSPHNSETWVLNKKFRGIEVRLGLAYDEHSTHIDPRYSYFHACEVIEGKALKIKDQARLAELYSELINKIVRPLVNPGFLYPQARFLLKQALVSKNTINSMIDPLFVAQLLTNADDVGLKTADENKLF